MTIKVFFDNISDADKVAERLEIKKDCSDALVVESKEVAKSASEKEKVKVTTYSIAEVKKATKP